MSASNENDRVDPPENPPNGAARRLGAFRAVLAGFLGYGLGYVYVGRPALGIGYFAALLGCTAVVGWSRLILIPAVIYPYAALMLVISLTGLIHPAILARRYGTRTRRPYNRWWLYALWTVVTSAAMVLVFSNRALMFGFEPFRAASASMSPTLESGELFMVNTWVYRSSSPAPGDVVVYSTMAHPGVKYVKRVVGVPGDRLEIRSAVLFRNGQRVPESYLHPPRDAEPNGRDDGPVVLGPNEFYVLGDYRDLSMDSRVTGPVLGDEFHGRAEYIWFSAGSGGILWGRLGRTLSGAR